MKYMDASLFLVFVLSFWEGSLTLTAEVFFLTHTHLTYVLLYPSLNHVSRAYQ